MKKCLKPTPTTLRLVRCAIYTRKSTEEGLEQEFNSLDAQREAGEAYVRSQQHEGWTCLPDRYDDGGFTGGNMDRPALQRLLADIQAGKIDVVVVYKIDRLSRSLIDFTRMLEVFEANQVTFVAVTQLFNTANSMGRLMLNVLLSFAQFEREIISERTRDKIAATRRKGKWSGGTPLLGYDLDPQLSKLIVNADEAERVRAIFALYEQHGSLLPVVQELARRGWTNKLWTTKSGAKLGGKAFTRTNLYRLLTNIAYTGKVKYRDEVHDGEHAAIVDPGVFQRVQAMLQRNGSANGPPVRHRPGSLLRGLLRCTPCECAMTPTYAQKGGKRYRYYLCSNASKRGWDVCPSKSVPAGQIEQFVLDELRCIGSDHVLLQDVLKQAREEDEAQVSELQTEQHGLEKDLARWHGEINNLSALLRPGEDNGPLIARLADLQERVGLVEGRVRKVREQVHAVRNQLVDQDEASLAMALFDPAWETLPLPEQAQVVQMLVKEVNYDGSRGKVSIAFHHTGLRTLAAELNKQDKEIA
jgi:site-specific DNA recombinase